MSLDAWVLVAILAMTVASYACRAGGYAILRLIRPPPFIEAMLRHLPGALFVAYVVPALANWGPAGWIGGAAAYAAQRAFRNFGISVVISVAVVALARVSGL